jgi:hypothetical protein
MLAPFVVNLLIACMLMMLAGWTSDMIGVWVHASRQAATTAVGLRRPLDPRERFHLHEPEGAGYTLGVGIAYSCRHFTRSA